MIDAAVRALFRTAARLRHDRALHPRGDTFDAVARIHPAGRHLADTDTVRAVVRLSRGIGLREPLPDFNGIAVRLLDAHGPGGHQDVLTTSAWQAPVLRHVLRPTRTFSSAMHTTVLGYRDHQGRRVMLGVPALSVSTLDEAAAALPFTLTLQIATAHTPWEDAATVAVQARHDAGETIRFDPFVTGPGLTPAGLVNRLRPPAYAASRAGAPVPRGRR